MKQKSINITGKNGLNNFIDMIANINDDEIRNDPKVPELVQELLKDLPPALTKKEAKNLTEEERIERNKKISQVREELYEKGSPEDDTDRIFFTIRKENGQIPASYEHMREGAIRSTAWEMALSISEARYIRSKEEIKRIKEAQKEFSKEFAKIFKEEYIKSMQDS